MMKDCSKCECYTPGSVDISGTVDPLAILCPKTGMTAITEHGARCSYHDEIAPPPPDTKPSKKESVEIGKGATTLTFDTEMSEQDTAAILEYINEHGMPELEMVRGIVEPSFDPDAFAQRYADLLHEVEQLREHRYNLVSKYEKLRARVLNIEMHAREARDQRRAGTRSKAELAIRDLFDAIFGAEYPVRSQHPK